MAQIVDSIAVLRTTLPSNAHPLSAILTGYYQKNDKPRLYYYWDNDSELADNDGSIIQVDGVKTGRWIAQLDSILDPRHFGAKGDNVHDDSSALTNAIEFLKDQGGGIVQISEGVYRINESIVLYPQVGLSGVIPQVSVISIGLKDQTEAAFRVISEIDVKAAALSVKNLSFTDSRPTAEKSIAPVLEIDKLLNTTIDNCQFRDLGGSSIRVSRSSNTTINNIYAFGCGKKLAKASEKFRALGIIHMDRERGFSNTLNLTNSYISNCSNATGISLASHAVRIHNCTVESCQTLIRLGSLKHVSRNIIVTGLYLENARVYGMELINLIGANFQNVYYRDSNVSKKMKRSVLMDNCRDILWNNASLGDFGFEVKRASTNIRFESCKGNYPKTGISGVNDSELVTDIEQRHGSFGTAANWIAKSNDFSSWSGSAKVSRSLQPEAGLISSLVSKNERKQHLRYPVKGSFDRGAALVFSVYVKGHCSLRIRGQQLMGNYKDLELREFPDTGQWRRIYVAAVVKEAKIDKIQLHLTPGNYGKDRVECYFAKAQFEQGRLTPGPYVETAAEVRQLGAAAVNGPLLLQGQLRGIAQGPPSSGHWNKGDRLDNTAPNAASPLGWICVSSGIPGQWISYGSLNIATGNKSERPSAPEKGSSVFDMELNKPIWFDGQKWVDAMGNSV